MDDLRPRFHFAAPTGWLNDPNGLVYQRGEYHLYYQHNPFSTDWGNMTWGHAVSRDLFHWEHLPHALTPYDGGTIFSGSAILDRENAAGLGKDTLLAFYTWAGQPFDQRLAYSTDRGRSFTQWPNNPVIAAIGREDRDPKVFYHAPTQQYVIVVYVRRDDRDGAEFFTSPNLTDWTFASRLEGLYECPDCFELPVVGEPGTSRWVLFGADGEYWLGQFDGRVFTPDGPKQRGDYGANFYAAQTYSDIPRRDGRRILIPWMRGGSYPGMPFNQQMGLPVALQLRRIGGELRLCRQPVRELSGLWETHWTADGLIPTSPPWPALECPLTGELWDIDATLTLGRATQVTITVNGDAIVCDVGAGAITVLGTTAPLPIERGRVRLRIVADRTSLEVYAGRGEVALSNCRLPETKPTGVHFACQGSEVRLKANVRGLQAVG